MANYNEALNQMYSEFNGKMLVKRMEEKMRPEDYCSEEAVALCCELNEGYGEVCICVDRCTGGLEYIPFLKRNGYYDNLIPGTEERRYLTFCYVANQFEDYFDVIDEEDC